MTKSHFLSLQIIIFTIFCATLSFAQSEWSTPTPSDAWNWEIWKAPQKSNESLNADYFEGLLGGGLWYQMWNVHNEEIDKNFGDYKIKESLTLNPALAVTTEAHGGLGSFDIGLSYARSALEEDVKGGQKIDDILGVIGYDKLFGRRKVWFRGYYSDHSGVFEWERKNKKYEEKFSTRLINADLLFSLPPGGLFGLRYYQFRTPYPLYVVRLWENEAGESQDQVVDSFVSPVRYDLFNLLIGYSNLDKIFHQSFNVVTPYIDTFIVPIGLGMRQIENQHGYPKKTPAWAWTFVSGELELGLLGFNRIRENGFGLFGKIGYRTQWLFIANSDIRTKDVILQGEDPEVTDVKKTYFGGSIRVDVFHGAFINGGIVF